MSEKSIKVVIVCSGNTCRSPMSEFFLAKALGQGPDEFEVIGVGLVSSGTGAEANAVMAMKKVGIDLGGYKSKKLSQDVVNEAAVIFCMTKDHLEGLKRSFNNLPKHCYLWRGFMDNVDVMDPFGCDLDTYIAVRDSISEAIPSIMKFLKEELNDY